jgi:amino acid permease
LSLAVTLATLQAPAANSLLTVPTAASEIQILEPVDHEKPLNVFIKPIEKEEKTFWSLLFPKPEASHDHKLSMFSIVINIIADLAPHGMLPLAFGLTAGGTVGIVPSIAVLVAFGIFSAYTMTTYAKLAEETNSHAMSEIWGKIIKDGKQTKWTIDAMLMALCFGCCVFYSAFIGDIFATLAHSITGSVQGKTDMISLFLTNHKAVATMRSVVLSLLHVLVVVPLCLMEDLSGLEVSSKLGVLGILYTVAFVVQRVSDSTYSLDHYSAAHNLLDSMPASKQPRFEEKLTMYGMTAPGMLELINIVMVAYLAHYNAIPYYNELKDATPAKFTQAMALGFTVVFLIFAAMMFGGYLLFGDTAQPLILNNFHSSLDKGAFWARVSIGFAIIFAYPLMWNAFRTSLYTLFPSLFNDKKIDTLTGNKIESELSNKAKRARQLSTISIVAVITAIAIQCSEEDVSIVLGFIGSILGTSLAFILPSYLAMANMKIRKGKGLTNKGADVLLAHLGVLIGVVFGVLGTKQTLGAMNSLSHHR